MLCGQVIARNADSAPIPESLRASQPPRTPLNTKFRPPFATSSYLTRYVLCMSVRATTSQEDSPCRRLSLGLSHAQAASDATTMRSTTSSAHSSFQHASHATRLSCSQSCVASFRYFPASQSAFSRLRRRRQRRNGSSSTAGLITTDARARASSLRHCVRALRALVFLSRTVRTRENDAVAPAVTRGQRWQHCQVIVYTICGFELCILGSLSCLFFRGDFFFNFFF